MQRSEYGVLYPIAVGMGTTDFATFEHFAQVRRSGELSTMWTGFVNTRIKSHVGPAQGIKRQAPITSAESTNTSAASRDREPIASIACVPLISETASFASRTSGLISARRKASARKSGFPFHRDIRLHRSMPSAKCARGARSPLAPTLPCEGTYGVTPRVSISQSVSMTSWTYSGIPFGKRVGA